MDCACSLARGGLFSHTLGVNFALLVLYRDARGSGCFAGV